MAVRMTRLPGRDLSWSRVYVTHLHGRLTRFGRCAPLISHEMLFDGLVCPGAARLGGERRQEGGRVSISSSWALASDAELITAVRSGESAAFGVLYERHVGAARAVAHQYSNASADAEDAVADAFQRVFGTIQGGAEDALE